MSPPKAQVLWALPPAGPAETMTWTVSLGNAQLGGEEVGAGWRKEVHAERPGFCV